MKRSCFIILHKKRTTQLHSSDPCENGDASFVNEYSFVYILQQMWTWHLSLTVIRSLFHFSNHSTPGRFRMTRPLKNFASFFCIALVFSWIQNGHGRFGLTWFGLGWNDLPLLGLVYLSFAWPTLEKKVSWPRSKQTT